MNAYPLKAALVAAFGYSMAVSVLAQHDPGVRGGIQNTAGGLQQQGIPIPHPPVISPNPTTGATINDNELASFLEGIRRAGQLESTCDDCADVTRRLAGRRARRTRPGVPAVPHQFQRAGRAPQRRSVLRCAMHSRRSAAPAASSCPIPGRSPPMPPENPHVPAGSASLRQAERRPVVRKAVRADPRSALQVQARRHARRRRPSALDRARHHERSDHPELQHRPARLRGRARRRATCRSGFRCR